MVYPETSAKTLVWLGRLRAGCVALVLVPFVLLRIPAAIHKEGAAFGLGYLVSGIVVYGGIPFVLWTLLILIAKTIMIRTMTLPKEEDGVINSHNGEDIDT